MARVLTTRRLLTVVLKAIFEVTSRLFGAIHLFTPIVHAFLVEPVGAVLALLAAIGRLAAIRGKALLKNLMGEGATFFFIVAGLDTLMKRLFGLFVAAVFASGLVHPSIHRRMHID